MKPNPAPAGTLLVFLKYPEPGRVKTRLASAIGPTVAASLYSEFLSRVLNQIQPLRPAFKIVAAFDGAEPDAFAMWHRLVDRWYPQSTGDLGCRLDAGFRIFHTNHLPVLAIGTDCLEIDAELIQQAAEALQTNDVVFGPASDGGYYLVGTSQYLPGFFDSIRWSSAETLQDHLARCREHHWQVQLLPQREDIDTWDDWVRYCHRYDIDPRAIPDTN